MSSSSSSKPPPSSLLSKSLASASSLVVLQVFSRLFTFALNQVLVRWVSPQVFGTAAIQFELLLSTILFLSREGFRIALLRAQSSSSQNKRQQHSKQLITNLSLLPVLLGIPVSLLTTLVYTHTTSQTPTASQPHFHLSVLLYTLSAFLELLTEPLYISTQNELRFDVRVRAEGTAVVVKSVCAFVGLVLGGEEWALVAFAVGQVGYAVALVVGFGRAHKGRLGEFWLKSVKVDVHGNKKTKYFDTPLLHLSGAMTVQSVIKHFLTEGDKFLVSRLSPLADQGGYAVASNYGSLVARILFQPIEETCRLFFSKTLTSGNAAVTQEALDTAANVLHTLLLFFTHLFLLLLTFAPPYLPLAISILLPWRYHQTSAPSILQTYVYYIPMMAFNGVLEAVFASTATPTDLRVQSRWMLLFSAGFVGAAVTFSQTLKMGDAGLVWANVVNLMARAVYAWVFVKKYFVEKGAGKVQVSWRRAVPPIGVLVCFGLSGAVTRWSWASSVARGAPLTILGQAKHVGVGIVCVLACLAACVILERRTFQQVLVSLRRGRSE